MTLVTLSYRKKYLPTPLQMCISKKLLHRVTKGGGENERDKGDKINSITWRAYTVHISHLFLKSPSLLKRARDLVLLW